MRKELEEFFESRTMHVIVALLTTLNTLALGIETTPSLHEDYKETLEMLHHIILTAFTIEIMLRLFASGPRFFKSWWNIFDIFVVGGSYLPINGGLSALRSLRILHLFSMIEEMPKTRHIVMGFYRSLPGIVNVVFLMIFLFFVSSVMGVYLFQDGRVQGFVSLGASMHTLFQVLTGDDWHKVMESVLPVFPHAWVFFYAYYVIMVFLVLNLFIGVVVGALEQAESEVYQEEEGFTVQRKLAEIHNEVKMLKVAISSQSKQMTMHVVKAAPTEKATPQMSKQAISQMLSKKVTLPDESKETMPPTKAPAKKAKKTAKKKPKKVVKKAVKKQKVKSLPKASTKKTKKPIKKAAEKKVQKVVTKPTEKTAEKATMPSMTKAPLKDKKMKKTPAKKGKDAAVLPAENTTEKPMTPPTVQAPIKKVKIPSANKTQKPEPEKS